MRKAVLIDAQKVLNMRTGELAEWLRKVRTVEKAAACVEAEVLSSCGRAGVQIHLLRLEFKIVADSLRSVVDRERSDVVRSVFPEEVVKLVEFCAALDFRADALQALLEGGEPGQADASLVGFALVVRSSGESGVINRRLRVRHGAVAALIGAEVAVELLEIVVDQTGEGGVGQIRLWTAIHHGAHSIETVHCLQRGLGSESVRGGVGLELSFFGLRFFLRGTRSRSVLDA